MQALAQDRQRVGRVVRRQVQEDDVVGRVPVGRDLARRQQVGHDPRDVRRVGMSARLAAAADSNAGVPASSVGLEKTTTRADGGTPSSVPRSAFARADSRSSRMKPAGAQRARDLWRERQGHAAAAAPRPRRPTTRGARRTGPGVRRGSRLIVRVVARMGRREPAAESARAASCRAAGSRPARHLLASRPCSSSSSPSSSPSRSGSPRSSSSDDRDHPEVRDVGRGRLGLGQADHEPERKFLFAFLFIGWAVVFGIGLQLVPHTGANSPYGGIGLIALFSGFFIMMGFLWAVIGE